MTQTNKCNNNKTVPTTNYVIEAENDPFKLKFIVESSLGKIARHLRLLGIDCECDASFNRAFILFKAFSESRIVITTALSVVKKIIKTNNPPFKRHKYEVYSDDSEDEVFKTVYHYYLLNEQTSYPDKLLDVVNYFKIPFDCQRIFSRCMYCNVLVDKMSRNEYSNEELLKKMGSQEAVDNYADTISKCPKCERMFWIGHYYHKCEKWAKKFSYNKSSTENCPDEIDQDFSL